MSRFIRFIRIPLEALRADVAAPSRWPALDGVRGAALLAVVGYHVYRLLYFGPGGPGGLEAPVWAWPLGLGKFAIDVFFVLSGLLVVLSWRSIRRRDPGWRSHAEFWRRRARRVLPVWWVSLLVLVPLSSSRLGLLELGALATVQQYLFDGLPAEVNVVSWSLTTEVHFYLAVPLVVWAIDRVGGPVVLAASLLLSVAWWHGSLVDHPTSLLPGRLDQFVAGALAGAVVVAHARGEHRPVLSIAHHPATPWVLASVVAVLGVNEGMLVGRPHLIGPLSELGRPLFGLAVALWFVRRLTRPGATSFTGPLLRGLGAVSYSAYLWHFPILFAVLSAAGTLRIGVDRLPAAVAATGLALSLTAVVTVASYLLVERPFMARSSRGRPGGSARREPSPALATR